MPRATVTFQYETVERFGDDLIFKDGPVWIAVCKASDNPTFATDFVIRDKTGKLLKRVGGSPNVIIREAPDGDVFDAPLEVEVYHDKTQVDPIALKQGFYIKFLAGKPVVPPVIEPEPEPEPPPAPDPDDIVEYRVIWDKGDPPGMNVRADHDVNSTKVGDLLTGTIVECDESRFYLGDGLGWLLIVSGEFTGNWVAFYSFEPGDPFAIIDEFLIRVEDYEEPPAPPPTTAVPSAVRKVGGVLEVHGERTLHIGTSLDRDAIFPEDNQAKDAAGNYPVRQLFATNPDGYWGQPRFHGDKYIGKARDLFSFIRYFAVRRHEGGTRIQDIIDANKRILDKLDEFNTNVPQGLVCQTMYGWPTFGDAYYTHAAFREYEQYHDGTHGGLLDGRYMRERAWTGIYQDTTLAVIDAIKEHDAFGGVVLTNEYSPWEFDETTLNAIRDFYREMSIEIRKLTTAPISPGWINPRHAFGKDHMAHYLTELAAHLDICPLHVYQNNITDANQRWHAEEPEDIALALQAGYVVSFEEYGQNVALDPLAQVQNVVSLYSRNKQVQWFSVWAYFFGDADWNLHSGGFMNNITSPTAFAALVDRIYNYNRSWPVT